MVRILGFLFGCFFIFQLSIHSINACSVIETPLRKQFRKADAVFIGKVTKVIEYEPTEKELNSIPENWRDWKIWSKVTFEIDKKWKGNISKNQEFIAVSWYICGCDRNQTELKAGEEFLVFSQGKNFVNVCDTDKSESKYGEEKVKRINNLSFRLWSSIYPF